MKSVNTQFTKFSDTGLLTTKQVSPQQCLSCGGFTNQNNPFGSIKGSDGKLYKADFRPTSVEHYERDRVVMSKSMMTAPEEKGTFFGTPDKKVNAGYGEG
mmetsp:Transcript_30398/g.27643  ORF Transcript_30398/g.27643 Transcript_30398/m.27643 type:complete len:100 (-) Transcript_30398:256-555(-)